MELVISRCKRMAGSTHIHVQRIPEGKASSEFAPPYGKAREASQVWRSKWFWSPHRFSCHEPQKRWMRHVSSTSRTLRSKGTCDDYSRTNPDHNREVQGSCKSCGYGQNAVKQRRSPCRDRSFSAPSVCSTTVTLVRSAPAKSRWYPSSQNSTP